jgi:hypothetical protein
MISSPIIYWILRHTLYAGSLPDKWRLIKNLCMDDFSKIINQFKYKSDFLLLDFSPEEPDFFFVTRKSNRDCDDWARMWFWWAQENGDAAWLIVVYDGLKRGHKACIFLKNGIYFLADYTIQGEYSSLEEAVNQFRVVNEYKNLIWFKTRAWKK